MAVSDGTALHYITKGQEPLSLPLGTDGGWGVNMQDDDEAPRLVVSKDAAVYATATGVHAVTLSDMAEAWRIDADVQSWTVAGDKLLITTTGGSLATADFSIPLDEAQSADPLPVPTPARSAITADELKNETLEVPENCAEFTGVQNPGRFVDGRLEGRDSGSPGAASASITDVKPTIIDGAPASVVRFQCDGGGSWIYGALAVYDQDLKQIATLESDGSFETGVENREWAPREFTPIGETITVSWSGVAVSGDEQCHACRQSASATSTFTWNGERLVQTDIVYHYPYGDVRPPKMHQVRKWVAAASTGDDAAIADMTSPGLMEGLKDSYFGAYMPGETPPAHLAFRAVMFPEGVQVAGCTRIGSGAASFDGKPIVGLEGMSYQTVDDGSNYACPLTGMGQNGTYVDRSNEQKWGTSLLVLSDANGSITAVGTTRDFS